MIIEAIINVFLSLLAWAPLPTWEGLDIGASIDVVFDKIGPYLGLIGWLNNYLPISEMLAMAGVLLGLWMAAHIYHGSIWLLSKLHITGGGSD